MNKESLRAITEKKWKFPFSDSLSRIVDSFSLTGKVAFYLFLSIFVISGLMLLWKVSDEFLVKIPTYGGSFSEGIVGSPRFVNPLLAVSDIDRDLTSIIYSGLLKINSEGNLVPDLAESYSISEDGKIYTFILKENIYFHDNSPVTVDDVIFTIEKTKDEIIKSPRKNNWEGVEVVRVDDKTLEFILRQPFSPFIQNATLGILPKHIWQNISSEEFPFSPYNINPVGSGPYKVDSVTYNSGGLPREYKLGSFTKYISGRPYISHINIKTYQTERELVDSYKKGDINSIYGAGPQILSELSISQSNLKIASLSRIFGIFFNQNSSPALLRKEVREALSLVTDKDEIIQTVLGGLAQPINGPIPPRIINESSDGFSEENIEKAKSILTSNGWTQASDGIFERGTGNDKLRLHFSITTSASPELKLAAQILQSQWQKIGALVDVKIFEANDLTQNIIKPRRYDALLFGKIIGREMDLYSFWHSSQRNDPGLNVSMYTSLRVDRALETLRIESNEEKRDELLQTFSSEINNDIPAIFIYSPYFTYIVPSSIQNINLGQITMPSDRWNGIGEWFIETNSVWKIFTE